MECDPIAFRVNDDGAKTVRADLLLFFQNFAAICAGRFDCFVESAFHRKINKRAGLRRLILIAYAIATRAKAAGRILFFVW